MTKIIITPSANSIVAQDVNKELSDMVIYGIDGTVKNTIGVFKHDHRDRNIGEVYIKAEMSERSVQLYFVRNMYEPPSSIITITVNEDGSATATSNGDPYDMILHCLPDTQIPERIEAFRRFADGSLDVTINIKVEIVSQSIVLSIINNKAFTNN